MAEASGGRPRFARPGVRARTVAAAVAVVMVVLVGAAFALSTLLRDSLTDAARDDAEARAESLARDIDASGALTERALTGSDDHVVQVVDEAGTVVASSPELASDEPLVHDLDDDDALVDDVAIRDDDEIERADHVVAAETADDGTVVLVGRSLESVDESIAELRRLLVLGIPVVLVVLGAVIWIVVGRALDPVERARAAVAEISDADLDRRIPEPGTDDEVGRLTRTLNAMLARLQEAQQRQRRLVSDSSHELRSPVAAIRNQAEVALAHPEDTTVVQLAGDVLAEDLRLERLVDDLLWIARADERAPERTHTVVDLDDVVIDEARRARTTDARRIDASAVSAGRVDGDPAELRRVVRNLVDNAARHARSVVTIGLGERGAQVVLTVDDDGPGIPEVDRARVFERFVRLDEARSRDAGGSGLGLAIVAEIVRRHDGAVTAVAAPGGGARFEVVLPTAR